VESGGIATTVDECEIILFLKYVIVEKYYSFILIILFLISHCLSATT